MAFLLLLFVLRVRKFLATGIVEVGLETLSESLHSVFAQSPIFLVIKAVIANFHFLSTFLSFQFVRCTDRLLRVSMQARPLERGKNWKGPCPWCSIFLLGLHVTEPATFNIDAHEYREGEGSFPGDYQHNRQVLDETSRTLHLFAFLQVAGKGTLIGSTQKIGGIFFCRSLFGPWQATINT